MDTDMVDIEIKKLGFINLVDNYRTAIRDNFYTNINSLDPDDYKYVEEKKQEIVNAFKDIMSRDDFKKYKDSFLLVAIKIMSHRASQRHLDGNLRMLNASAERESAERLTNWLRELGVQLVAELEIF